MLCLKLRSDYYRQLEKERLEQVNINKTLTSLQTVVVELEKKIDILQRDVASIKTYTKPNKGAIKRS